MPNAKPRKGTDLVRSRTGVKGSNNAEEDSQATFTLQLLELLGDTEVVSKIKKPFIPTT